MSRPALLVFAAGICLAAAAGCNRIESPRDHWFGRVASGTLQPIPFSHDLELLGYDGWQFLGKLPAALAGAEAVEFAIWIQEEGLTDDAPERAEETPVFRASWEPGDRSPRRIDVDLLILRVFEDGQPIYRFRAVVNGSEISQRFAAPEGYRHELSAPPVARPGPIRPGQPIPLGTATLTTWSRQDGTSLAYTLDARTYRWYLQLDPVEAR